MQYCDDDGDYDDGDDRGRGGQDVKMNQIVRGAGGRRFRMYFRNRE